MNNYERLLWGRKYVHKNTSKEDNTLNSYGYRCPEFDGTADLIVAGCSFTDGVGTEYPYIWGKRVADELDVPWGSISHSGVGIPWIVDRLFEYFNEFGNPKILMCLFPEPQRTDLVVDGEVVKALDWRVHGVRGTYDTHNEDYSKYIHHENPLYPAGPVSGTFYKKPFNSWEVVYEDATIYLAVRAIRHLEQYCKAAGIQFVWTTWNNAFYRDLMALDEDLKFDNFFDGHSSGLTYNVKNGKQRFYKNLDLADACREIHENASECDCYDRCHLEEEAEFTRDYWHLAHDMQHPGVHGHIHIAEVFLRQLKKITV